MDFDESWDDAYGPRMGRIRHPMMGEWDENGQDVHLLACYERMCDSLEALAEGAT